MKPQRNRMIKLGVTAASLVLTIGLLEVGFRVFADHEVMVGTYIPDERLHHVHPANLSLELDGMPPELPPYEFKTNELGLPIGEPYSLARPLGTRRIVVCGDSFIQGFEYRRSIPARLERALAPLAGARSCDIEVINAGIGSYSPMLHYFALRSKLLQLEPDAVILAIDATDAYDDAFRYKECLVTDRRGEAVGVRSKIGQQAALLGSSMVKHLPRSSLSFWIAAMRPYSAVADSIFLRNLDGFAQRYGHLIEPGPKEVYPFLDAQNPGTREWIEYSQLWVEKTVSLLRSQGVNVAIAVYPHLEHLQIPRLQQSFKLYEKFAREQNVLFHDATPAFERQPDVRSLFLTGDMHYNYDGQEVWADDLSQFVIAHLDELIGARSEPSR